MIDPEGGWFEEDEAREDGWLALGGLGDPFERDPMQGVSYPYVGQLGWLLGEEEEVTAEKAKAPPPIYGPPLPAGVTPEQTVPRPTPAAVPAAAPAQVPAPLAAVPAAVPTAAPPLPGPSPTIRTPRWFWPALGAVFAVGLAAALGK